MPLLLSNHSLAVDDCLAHAELLCSARDGGKLVGPVEAFARVESDIAGTDVELGAVAVPLNLVQPFVARGRDFAQDRIARLHTSSGWGRIASGQARVIRDAATLPHAYILSRAVLVRRARLASLHRQAQRA
jgi:hypothetical protein